MTRPITVPLELVEKWGHDANLSGVPYNDEHWTYEQDIATRAARWGADQELDACCRWLPKLPPWSANDLRKHRRPKPPSLKEQALAVLEEEPEDAKELIVFDTDQVNIIRRALEALPND